MAAHGERAPMRDAVEGAGLVSEMAAFFTTRDRIAWVVTPVRDDEVIGTCTLFGMDVRHRRVEVGYALHPAHWGRGLACDAVATAIDWSRRALGVLEVVAEVAPGNVRSQALLGRLGFLQSPDDPAIGPCAGTMRRYRSRPDCKLAGG